jgi:uncharacterized membrane protein YsdA (DUF1294 family)
MKKCFYGIDFRVAKTPVWRVEIKRLTCIRFWYSVVGHCSSDFSKEQLLTLLVRLTAPLG